MIEEKLYRTISKVTGLLAEGRYEAIVLFSGGIRLNEAQLEEAVTSYGRQITTLSKDGFNELDIIAVDGALPQRWSVNVPIYTIEEGRSDLTLELTLIDSLSDFYTVEIDNLHVM